MSFKSYISVKGQKQGQFKGEPSKTGRHNKWIELTEFKMGSQVPYDPSTGRPTGARHHSPITVTKEWGSSTPLLMNAHWTSEILDEVVIEVAGRRSTGTGEEVVERITLTNALITHVRQYGDAATGHSTGKLQLDFHLNYDKIDFEIH